MKTVRGRPDRLRRRTLLALAALLPGCTAGPDYRRPVLSMPEGWKVEAPFRAGTPDDGAAKGPWWQRFGDPTLDDLQGRAMRDSATLEIAAARLAQTGALLETALSARYPQVAAALRDQRLRISGNRPLTNYAQRQFTTVQDDYLAVLSVSYEVDFAGRVQRSIEGARANAAQSAADFENARLLLSADLSTAYFNLRAVDIELDVLARSIALQQRSLSLARSRHELGAASGLDIAQQQALVDSTLTQVDLLRRQRSQFEHAIATLTGSFPGKLQFGPAWWFNDHSLGIRQHLEALASYGLLSTFIGMTTDSRSFLSMSRHEYFRRVLCNFLAGLSEDETLTTAMVRGICHDNAHDWLQP